MLTIQYSALKVIPVLYFSYNGSINDKHFEQLIVWSVTRKQGAIKLMVFVVN